MVQVAKTEKRGHFSTASGCSLLELYLKFAELRGLSPSTITLYRDVIGAFYRGRDKTEGIGSTIELMDYISNMMKRENRPGTININLRALKTFFRWAVKQGLIEANPADSIPLARERATYLPTLTRTQIQALFEAARKEQKNSARNLAILSLLLDCALRPGELLSLRLDDQTLEQNVIRVKGKMGERLLPFGPVTRKALLAWLRKRTNLEGENTLFITNRGEPMGKEALRS